MNDKVKGIVLRISDYKDNDLMLQVLTEDLGIVSLIAKSAKKITSKKHYYEACLYEFMIDLKDNKTIYSIHNSKLIKSYFDLNNTKLFSFKNILLELVYKTKEMVDGNTYKNLLFVFDNINDSNKYLLGSLFVSYMLDSFGILPNVDECVICKNKKVVSLSYQQGGFLCIDHANGEKIFDVETLKTFRLLVKAKFKDYEIIKNTEVKYDIFKLLIEFYEINSSLNLKTYEFYRRVVQ